MDGLKHQGIDAENRIKLSDRAHLVFDFHQQVDGISEHRLGRNKIGTTKKGIGPAYASKISRNGIRIGDLENFDFFEMRFRELTDAQMRAHPGLEIDVEGQLEYYRSIADRVTAMMTDTIEFTNEQYDMGKKILIEGANATMLDIDFGTYPYVTSSNPSIGSVLTGLGVSPKKIHGIYGTTKAYCTRVGEGPFPTELERDGKFVMLLVYRGVVLVGSMQTYCLRMPSLYFFELNNFNTRQIFRPRICWRAPRSSRSRMGNHHWTCTKGGLARHSSNEILHIDQRIHCHQPHQIRRPHGPRGNQDWQSLQTQWQNLEYYAVLTENHVRTGSIV